MCLSLQDDNDGPQNADIIVEVQLKPVRALERNVKNLFQIIG